MQTSLEAKEVGDVYTCLAAHSCQSSTQSETNRSITTPLCIDATLAAGLPRAFGEGNLTICWYPSIHLGGERQCGVKFLVYKTLINCADNHIKLGILSLTRKWDRENI